MTKFVGFILLILFLALLIGLPVMWLWNWVGVDVLSLPEIGFWEAVGISLLSSLLFKSSSSSSSK